MQSGFNGSPERWREARHGIVEAIDGDGSFLDVGCANGLRLGRRAIFSSDGSFRTRDSPRAEPVGELLRERGVTVAGELHQRSDEHEVELVVAWVDQE